MPAPKGILAALALTVFLGACAAGSYDRSVGRSAERQPLLSDSIFDVGYERIEEVYFEPVDIGTLTVDGLSGLSRIDENLSARRLDGRLQLLSGDVILADYPAPSPRDDDAWAELTVSALESARIGSEPLRLASTEDVYEAIFSAIAGDLDPYSRYVNPDQAEQERAFRDGYGGIGILLELDNQGRPSIQDVFAEGPAFEAGLRTDDRIVAVDGRDSREWGLEELGNNLRGPVNTMVQVTVQRGDGSERTFALRRRRVIPNAVSARYDDDVVIIRVSRFNVSTRNNVRDALEEAQETLGDRARGIILDLRGNPGGLLDQSVEVADLFMVDGEIIHTRGRHPDSRQQFLADSSDIANGLPLVVLLDGRSASGAEVVAAALQDSRRGVLVGASTYGKGSVQTVTRLPNDGELFLTWSRIFAPSGYTLHLQGVMPTICTSNGIEDADRIVAMFSSGQLAVPASLTALRQAAPDDERALERLREACPWREHDAELDVEVALRLLRDPVLFQQALAASTPPSLAARTAAE